MKVEKCHRMGDHDVNILIVFGRHPLHFLTVTELGEGCFDRINHMIIIGKLLTVTDLGEPHESLQVRRKLTGFVTSNHGTFFRSIVQPDSVVRRVFLP
ncbi:MAG: hypothetical protein D3916_16865 [Candidatus Electrothrix sp. MAN1_4]|nr:hypothetical protein [Candidatus Electrothrix sp. MAN1_4]